MHTTAEVKDLILGISLAINIAQVFLALWLLSVMAARK